QSEKRLIVVLESASLETAKVGGEYVLLQADRHRDRIKKLGRDPADYRPDIAHQCLLMLQDSPLNRAGLLQVFVRTSRNVLIQVDPQTRIPRTYDRFAGLMVQLLHKLAIHAAEGSRKKLLKVIKNPITDHLPAQAHKFITSVQADASLTEQLSRTPVTDQPVVFVIGAVAHGSISADYAEGSVSLSGYPLSAALACAKLTGEFETYWRIEELRAEHTTASRTDK
ncbi:hypothetical protein BOX15_Mlig005580g1, partial [Macrostomum lignano]